MIASSGALNANDGPGKASGNVLEPIMGRGTLAVVSDNLFTRTLITVEVTTICGVSLWWSRVRCSGGVVRDEVGADVAGQVVRQGTAILSNE